MSEPKQFVIQRNESFFAITLNLIEILITLVYLLKYIVKLTSNRFHIMMFSLLLLRSVFYIGYCAFFVEMFYHNQSSIRLFDISIYFVAISDCADFLAHSIFVIKYWVIAKKVTQIVTAKSDHRFTLKANFLWYGQISLVVGSQLALVIYFQFLQTKLWLL